jgi:hypothetical protein
MLKAALAGQLRWIVVDSLDRFGTKSAKRLMGYLADLEDAGCQLFDTQDKEWTGEDDGTEISAWVGGKASTREQKEKSKRCLGGMIAKAKSGEWQGGPPRLGFDVACFDRAGAELWRVVWEGRDEVGTTKRKGKMRPVYTIRRLKVYPDRSTERLDGNVVFRQSKDTQRMQIVPTLDEARRAAAQGVFQRYATEAVSFFDLAKWLNGLGIRNSMGNTFQSNDVHKMLGDEAYLGYPTFRKRRNGRFHRFDADGGIVPLEPELRGKDTVSDPADIVRSSERLFEPLVDRATWDTVQKKLAGRAKKSRGYVPKNPAMYLAGLVICAGCGTPMVARTDRMEFYCGTWDKHRTRGTLTESPCLRNGVRQEVLEDYIGQYLDETGKRLELLTAGPDAGPLTGQLSEQVETAWGGFFEGLTRLTQYLADHHTAEYDAILAEQQSDPSFTPDEFVAACIVCYRDNFDPTRVGAAIAALEAEHTAMMGRYADLPTPRAKEKAKAELAALEGRIEELEKQQEDAGDVVITYRQEIRDLQLAIVEAKNAMSSEAGVLALRRRAEALRGLLVAINCEFVVTGKKSSGPGQAGSRLSAVGFVPIAGDGMRVQADVGELVYGKP